MCKYLTDSEFATVFDALKTSVQQDDYDQTLDMLQVQDDAYAIMKAAHGRANA
jgi:hypothetical protein